MVVPGMDINAFIWVLLPVFVAAGSALLSYSIMQARLEVARARERATLAEANAAISIYKVTMEERIRAAVEETKRKALNEFLQEFRVEERQYMRENKSAALYRKTMVMQERLYFRNIPLSNWVEHELTMEETSQNALDKAPNHSIFTTRAIPPPEPEEDSHLASLSARLLRETA